MNTERKPQPKFTTVPANPGWWGKLKVADPGGRSKKDEFVYEPVAFWLAYYDETLGVFIDAPQAAASGGEIRGHARLSELEGFAGFVYDPTRTKTGLSV